MLEMCGKFGDDSMSKLDLGFDWDVTQSYGRKDMIINSTTCKDTLGDPRTFWIYLVYDIKNF